MFIAKMRNNFLNKRGATSLAIVLFTLMSLILIVYSVFSFLSYKQKSSENSIERLSDIYLAEEKISFYVKSIGLNEAVKIVKEENNDMEIRVDGKEVLIEKTYYENKAKKTGLIMRVSYKFKPEV